MDQEVMTNSMRHWKGLIPDNGRTACGKRSLHSCDIFSLSDIMFSYLIGERGTCPECAKAFLRERNHPSLLYPSITRVQCEDTTKPKTDRRPVGGAQCRNLAVVDSNPPRCWLHKGDSS